MIVSISQWVSGFLLLSEIKDIQMLNNACLFALQKLCMIVIILGGKQLKGHMRSYSAGWRKDELHGKIQIK